MVLFKTTIPNILAGAAIYVVVVSALIFIHWMWFTDSDLEIGKRKKPRHKLLEGKTITLRGLALPTAYYEKNKKKFGEEATS